MDYVVSIASQQYEVVEEPIKMVGAGIQNKHPYRKLWSV
jgi:hypothetical protein